MPTTSLFLKSVEWIVNAWISNTPKFMQPDIGWTIYEKIVTWSLTG